MSRLKQNKYQLFCIGLLIILSGCGCNYHLKRVIAKCPQTVFQDTVIVRDTLIVPSVAHDTTFFAQPGDTVYINKDRLKIRYVNLGEGRHNITGKCDTIWLSRYIKVPVTKTVIEPQNWVERNWWWMLVILIGLAFFKILR